MSGFDDMAIRLAALEDRLANLTVEDLPMSQLQRKLETNWEPLGSVLLEPKSVTANLLATDAAIIATQQHFGANAGYVPCGNGTNITVNAAQNILMRVNFTPPVDCWWEVHSRIGLLQKLDAAWHYGQMVQTLNVADVNGLTTAWDTQSSHNALPFVGLRVTTMWKLRAGVAYQAYCNFVTNGGSWQYYQGPNYLSIQGKAWAR